MIFELEVNEWTFVRSETMEYTLETEIVSHPVIHFTVEWNGDVRQMAGR